MLHTPLCDTAGVQYPLIQGAIAPFTTPELVAAVSNAGGLGSLGAVFRSSEQVREEIRHTRELTNRPFAVNFALATPSEEAFAIAVEERPAFISFARGSRGDLIHRTYDAGIPVIQQVHTVRQANEAVDAEADIITPRTEAGGLCGTVSTMILVPQVGGAVHPVPVVAFGGIADGRGLAAALVLGAQSVNIGTRFLAANETPTSDKWKQRILTAQSEDMVRVEFINDIFPPGPNFYGTAPRALRTPFIEEWQPDHKGGRREAPRLQRQLMDATRTALNRPTQHAIR